MTPFKYYKKEIAGTLMFLRIVKILGHELVYVQDLEIVPIDFEERFEYGVKHMTEIEHSEFVDLIRVYQLGALKERPLAGEPLRT